MLTYNNSLICKFVLRAFLCELFHNFKIISIYIFLMWTHHLLAILVQGNLDGRQPKASNKMALEPNSHGFKS